MVRTNGALAEISSVEDFHRGTMASSDGICYGKLRGLYSKCPEDRWFIGCPVDFPPPYALPPFCPHVAGA